jgi:hypothetical protein
LSHSVSKTATKVLGEQDKGRKTDDCFDCEGKAATDAKKKAYGSMQQRRCTRSSGQAYRTARHEEKKAAYIETEKAI